MKLIDVGLNLMDPSYDQDREQVIQAAAEAGVSPLVITASGERNCREALLYADRYNSSHPGALYCKAGLHPHDAKNWHEGSADFFKGLIREREPGDPGFLSQRTPIAAIGECGLDYNRDFSPRDIQRRCFVKQAELASELSLPLFLHERDAFEDFSAILGDHIRSVPAALVHCFTGSGDELEHYLSLGCYIGITGWVCDERRGKHLWDLVKRIPADKLMLESDGPYLLPRDLPAELKGSVKGRRNEPKYLPHINFILARLLDKDPRQLAKETYENSFRFFGMEIK